MGSCSPAEWGFPCTGVSRAGERDRSRVEKRSEGRGRKAEGLFGGPLALERGKGRQALPNVPKRNMKFPRLLWGLGKERGTDRCIVFPHQDCQAYLTSCPSKRANIFFVFFIQFLFTMYIYHSICFYHYINFILEIKEILTSTNTIFYFHLFTFFLLFYYFWKKTTYHIFHLSIFLSRCLTFPLPLSASSDLVLSAIAVICSQLSRSLV